MLVNNDGIEMDAAPEMSFMQMRSRGNRKLWISTRKKQELK